MRRFIVPIDETDENNPDYYEVEAVYLNGYNVGDRLLEDVMFEITLSVDGRFQASVTPDCAEYFSNLNQEKWLREIEAYCADRDLFSTDPHDGGPDAVCWDDALPNDAQTFNCPLTPRIAPRPQSTL